MYNNISVAAAAVDNINSAVHTSISHTSRQHVRTTRLSLLLVLSNFHNIYTCSQEGLLRTQNFTPENIYI